MIQAMLIRMKLQGVGGGSGWEGLQPGSWVLGSRPTPLL